MSNYSPETLGIFVTTVGYTQGSLEVAKKAKYNILLTNIDDLTNEFMPYANNHKKRCQSDDDDEIVTIESVELDGLELEKDASVSMFGVEIKGEVCLKNIKFKNVKIKRRKLE